MATYREIQKLVKARGNFVPKTCWIADVKSDFGLIDRIASTRLVQNGRRYPCPAHRRPAIEAALAHFNMIQL